MNEMGSISYEKAREKLVASSHGCSHELNDITSSLESLVNSNKFTKSETAFSRRENFVAIVRKGSSHQVAASCNKNHGLSYPTSNENLKKRKEASKQVGERKKGNLVPAKKEMDNNLQFFKTYYGKVKEEGRDYGQANPDKETIDFNGFLKLPDLKEIPNKPTPSKMFLSVPSSDLKLFSRSKRRCLVPPNKTSSENTLVKSFVFGTRKVSVEIDTTNMIRFM
eukprot:snap_masked-scaffold_5-processed-gene-17.24-mRNA-1 protein AED:1.00 eAED:1.00 QI:0/-1/0/0/-1/1/1/0/222